MKNFLYKAVRKIVRLFLALFNNIKTSRFVHQLCYEITAYFPTRYFKNLYDFAATQPSDINEHVPILYRYAKKCWHITEMGVRTGVSTAAFLYARPKKFIAYDLLLRDCVKTHFKLAKRYWHKNYQYIEADVLKIKIEPTDMLFIDTLHTYSQLTQELNLHAPNVKKYIAFHDVETFGEHGEVLNNEDYLVGIMPAIKEFLAANKNWKIIHHTKNNNGLLIIERSNSDIILN